MNTHPVPAILRALDALKALDRRTAEACLREEAADTGLSASRLRNLASLAAKTGAGDVEIAAMQRFAKTAPVTLEKILEYCQVLARFGKVDRVHQVINGLAPSLRDLPPVLHLLGTVASQTGDFPTAERLFRKVLDQTPHSAVTWHALAVVKTFALGDPDMVAMEGILAELAVQSPSAMPQMLYALAKAYDDAGLKSTAAEAYSRGAAMMRQNEPYNAAAEAEFAESIIREFTPQALAGLTPSGCMSDRAIFINGLPRSGTTLVDEILNRHPDVSDGGELNLMKMAMMPAGNFSLPAALSYQGTSATPDPWGDIGRDYQQLLIQRFGHRGRIVDKTLNQSRLMGLMLHALPAAKVIWLRRHPEDCALSCFRTFFANSLPWSWSFEDIARHFQIEDRLYSHWSELFPNRILTVPYEDLVTRPDEWIPKILAHVGLTPASEVFEDVATRRSVMTASVAQVRAPISSARVGSAQAYGQFLDAFREAYRG